MPRKTKYCLNFGLGKHLNDGKSPSHMHCSRCYEEVKNRLETIEKQGGPVEGLRAARVFNGGFSAGKVRGYSEKEKTQDLMAFFYYVMPHIPMDQARMLSRDIANNKS